MITQYARDSLSIELQLVGDWSAWTFKAEIREYKDHTSDLIETLTVDSSAAATGTITFSLTAAEVQAITATTGWLDLRAENGTAETTFVQDQIEFVSNVTA